MANRRSPSPKLSLKARALRALSQRDYTVQELRRKLQSLQDSEGQLDAVIQELQQKGFLSEERAIQSHIHRRSAKLGLARIKTELQAKGADAQVLEGALQDLQRSELERAQQVWQKKFGHDDRLSLDGLDEDAGTQEEGRDTATSAERAQRLQAQQQWWAKQIRFLLGRGFSMQIAQKVVRAQGALE